MLNFISRIKLIKQIDGVSEHGVAENFCT